MAHDGTRFAAALVAVLAIGIVPFVASGEPAGAQAAPVRVRVSTTPARPAAGEQVEVRVRAANCAGEGIIEGVRAEVFVLGDDTSTASAALVGRGTATTSLWFRATAAIELEAPPKGWYGVRVLCGSFRPPRGALPGTTFAIGAEDTRTARALADSVPAGGTVRVEGGGCSGPAVEYEVARGAVSTAAFQPAGSIPTAPDGTWSGDVVVPPSMPAGPATVRVRCLVEGIDGTRVELRYDEVPTITVVEATTAPAGEG